MTTTIAKALVFGLLLLFSGCKFTVPVAPVGVEQIYANRGGDVDSFKEWANDLKETDQVIPVFNYCASACTVAMDIARDNFCITQRTELYFHQSKFYTLSGEFIQYGNLKYSPDLQDWIDNNGGLPRETSLVMRYKDAKQFWSTCE